MPKIFSLVTQSGQLQRAQPAGKGRYDSKILIAITKSVIRYSYISLPATTFVAKQRQASSFVVISIRSSMTETQPEDIDYSYDPEDGIRSSDTVLAL
jgi:hypothetical protein